MVFPLLCNYFPLFCEFWKLSRRKMRSKWNVLVRLCITTVPAKTIRFAKRLPLGDGLLSSLHTNLQYGQCTGPYNAGAGEEFWGKKLIYQIKNDWPIFRSGLKQRCVFVHVMVWSCHKRNFSYWNPNQNEHRGGLWIGDVVSDTNRKTN